MATKPAPPSKPSSSAKPASSSSTTKPAAPAQKKPSKPIADMTIEEKVAAVAAKQITFAQAMGLTRTEAYGLAFSAHRFFEHGQIKRAKVMLDALMVANPNDGYFPALLGAIHGREGNEDEALKLYNLSLKLDPNNLSARVNRADLLLRRGELPRALDDLVAATRLDPTGKTPLGKRAIALARTTSQALHEAIGKKKSR